jgi:hypothetical protein
MAFGENAEYETRMASSNVSALSFTSSDGATIVYSSGGIAQFTAVVEDTSSGGINDVTTPAAAGAKAVGIAQDAPAVGPGQPVRVCTRGVCKAVAGAAIAVGDSVYIGGTNGYLITMPTSATNFSVGRALTPATASGDIFSVEVRPSDGKVTL